MNDDVKAAIDEIANSLQVISLLSTRLRQDSASQRNTRLISKEQQLVLFAR
jgi:hypothetical protein